MRSIFAAWLSIAWLAGAGCAEACSPAAWQPYPSAVLGLSGVAPGSAGHATHRTAAPEHRAPRDGAPCHEPASEREGHESCCSAGGAQTALSSWAKAEVAPKPLVRPLPDAAAWRPALRCTAILPARWGALQPVLPQRNLILLQSVLRL